MSRHSCVTIMNKSRRRCVFLFAISCAVVSAQNIAVITGDWNKSGINIIPGVDAGPNFVALASTIWQHSSFDPTPLYHYSFIITNLSGRAIVAFSARWAVTGLDGQTTMRDSQSAFGSFDGNHGIVTGKSHLVTPITGLNGLNDPPARSVAQLTATITQVQQALARISR